jgi:hypothetical protein
VERWWRRAVPEMSAQPGADAPGRVCPVDYHLGAQAFRSGPSLHADVLYVVGGLYGNTVALEALLKLFESERTAARLLVFNGDFHWFDRDANAFMCIEKLTSAHVRLRGNVETEIARDGAQAGCGCAYPQQVDDATVERSNRILGELKSTATQLGLAGSLGKLPMVAMATVGQCRIAITHGDEQSLAGWRFTAEQIDAVWRDGLADTLRELDAQLIASSHTCSPVATTYDDGERRLAMINNGAAGMANFAGSCSGLFTRIAVPGCPAPADAQSLYSARIAGVEVAAYELPFDDQRWQSLFETQWPTGSDAHCSYWGRITQGTLLSPEEAVKGAFALTQHAGQLRGPRSAIEPTVSASKAL